MWHGGGNSDAESHFFGVLASASLFPLCLFLFAGPPLGGEFFSILWRFFSQDLFFSSSIFFFFFFLIASSSFLFFFVRDLPPKRHNDPRDWARSSPPQGLPESPQKSQKDFNTALPQYGSSSFSSRRLCCWNPFSPPAPAFRLPWRGPSLFSFSPPLRAHIRRFPHVPAFGKAFSHSFVLCPRKSLIASRTTPVPLLFPRSIGAANGAVFYPCTPMGVPHQVTHSPWVKRCFTKFHPIQRPLPPWMCLDPLSPASGTTSRKPLHKTRLDFFSPQKIFLFRGPPPPNLQWSPTVTPAKNFAPPIQPVVFPKQFSLAEVPLSFFFSPFVPLDCGLNVLFERSIFPRSPPWSPRTRLSTPSTYS